MRVLHFASGDTWAGAERVISLLVEEQQQHPDLECRALLLNDGQLADALRACGIPVRVLPEQGRSFGSLIAEIRSELRSAEIVHAHRYKEIIASVLATILGRQGLVVTVHGLQPAAQLSTSDILQVWGALWLARMARAQIAAVSCELGERIERVLRTPNVRVIPNPAPHGAAVHPTFDLRERLGWNGARPVVGFVGRLEYVKGPDLLLAIAGQTNPDVGFVYIGEGSMEESLRHQAQTAGLGERVRFLGSVPDAMPLIRQLDVLALPSRHEGLPMVLLEAAALALPVVAFDVGGVGQVLDNGPAATLVRSGELAHFTHELERIIRSRHELDRDVEQWARSVRDDFDVRHVAASYLEMYRRALGARAN